MGRRGVDVKIKFFHVLSMIAFAIGQPVEPFLEYWIFSIPESRGEAKDLVAVAKTGNGFFSPSIRIASCHVMVYKIPGFAIGAIIFSHRTPLPVRNIRTPLFPTFIIRRVGQPFFLSPFHYYAFEMIKIFSSFPSIAEFNLLLIYFNTLFLI